MDHQDKPVLVTGASSGIGKAIVEHLSSKNKQVIATIRKQEDAAPLQQLENVEPFLLDVTNQAHIDNLAGHLEKNGNGLWGIVNNAGIGHVKPLIETPLEDMKRVFDVNTYGIHRINNTLIEHIIDSEGRIVNISSISGILSGPIFGPYSMSKHAVEAYTDSLAITLQELGMIHVSVVEPGNYKSQIGKNFQDNFETDYENSRFERIRSEEFIQRMKNPQSMGADPVEVAEAVYHALYDEKPLRRYMVVPVEEEQAWTITKAIDELVELNQYGKFKYSKEELLQLVSKRFDELNK